MCLEWLILIILIYAIHVASVVFFDILCGVDSTLAILFSRCNSSPICHLFLMVKSFTIISNTGFVKQIIVIILKAAAAEINMKPTRCAYVGARLMEKASKRINVE